MRVDQAASSCLVDVPPERSPRVPRAGVHLAQVPVIGVVLLSAQQLSFFSHVIIEPVTPDSHCGAATQNLPSGGWEKKISKYFLKEYFLEY